MGGVSSEHSRTNQWTLTPWRTTDLKATALLKLIYLEMFGHDMSWASFHVLEVMSSAKYLQKRVGYLGAVQSFGPNTEVLMLATNLLKKDLTSPLQPTIALPLVTIPHIITPSLALSLLSDLLPRLSHSSPAIRKKTIVTLYRLALVYPETLRAAWPKIKERLMDENEDSTVIAAIVNVVCELGWRRPQDFLPLAPRLFDLLVDGANNWMSIKIIKLFATLTPLEPRLVKKLLRPLVQIIRSTPAMSLLYECINGIIEGGILDSVDGTNEGEEIASLCVDKLRGMIVVVRDPNLKYVALLAFNKIVKSHAHLVALHQDVVLECVDDADISIRHRALDLLVGMVTSENLVAIVGRLMRQLRTSPIASVVDRPEEHRGSELGVEPAADSDGEDPEESLRRSEKRSDQAPPLPEDYRIDVVRRIVDVCSRNTYANITDFEWYIQILVQLINLAPSPESPTLASRTGGHGLVGTDGAVLDVCQVLGIELVNVAVRVKGVRLEATRAAEALITVGPDSSQGTLAVRAPGTLSAIIWIVGEYAEHLAQPSETLTALLHHLTPTTRPDLLATALQAIPKVFSILTRASEVSWGPERKSMTSLLIARVVHSLEPLTCHPDLEVQERSVEYLELMRLIGDAVSSSVAWKSGVSDEDPTAPLLVTRALPSLFADLELNPVARGAQKKVPVPDGLDLDSPINGNLQVLLDGAVEYHDAGEHDDSHLFYWERPSVSATPQPAAASLTVPSSATPSYQQADSETFSDAEAARRRRVERLEKDREDPFYIASQGSASLTSTPLQNVIQGSGNGDVDLDAIPILDLEMEPRSASAGSKPSMPDPRIARAPKRPKRFDVVGDETFATGDAGRPSPLGVSESDEGSGDAKQGIRARTKKSLLQVDSSGLRGFSLESGSSSRAGETIDAPAPNDDDQEMAKAIQEVERLRLEMQRASERIHAADGVPPEGTVVKKKRKPKKLPGASSEVVVSASRKPREDLSVDQQAADLDPDGPTAAVKKKKKKKKKNEREKEEREGKGERREEAVPV
ncbi:MAG: AP-3 complex subunit delta [Caeruleum heppii]|nr:MAG: AP-3 complex subunit delta [Caeruleum heppii]